MPGFMIRDDIGGNTGPSNTMELLWQHRWLVDNLGGWVYGDSAFVAKEVTLPDLKLDRQEVLGGLVWYKFAKSVRWDDAIITFYDDQKVSDKIDSWRKEVYTEDGGILQHSTYKQDSSFLLLDGEGNTVKKITLKNSWPANISQGRLTYAESDFKLVVVTLAFDWAEITTENQLKSE